ncbi:ribonuclease N [Chryseobacterium sp. T16E-39]|uniref:ribonuclease domain-containing protein n=1 Tax=Chryseobacterium sp. T16E-39 TaxID=2015076 RepID=UPI000B5B3EB3|nr:ribonuclease domain-containing protein [Chryseobacterium sp. T16E-39]ASK30239.1 ribonuclease N [Chryseobacterium sp. T16E-39]
MNSKMRPLFFACLGLLFGMSVMYVFNKFSDSKKDVQNPKVEYSCTSANTTDQQSIEQLTAEKTVISYVKQNHQLPHYYITKNEARKMGWNPSQGNLCDVLPGRAIGGDRFGNREGSLPKGNQYFEADINYNCGNRNADRIIFTKNGDVYLTKNHYKSFEKQ